MRAQPQQPIYLDYNSTTAIDEAVLSKMNEVAKYPLNSSAIHSYGRKANAIIAEATSHIQQLLNAFNYEIIYTASATEATNTIFNGGDFKDILISKIEHASVFNCRPPHTKIHEIDCDENGQVNCVDLNKKLPSHPHFLVSVMACNNETGTLQPINEIAKITHQNLGLFHCDIVQAVGKIAIDLEDINVDCASISAHKINGPQGVGALIIRKGIDFKPLILGGKQQKSKRAGSLNIAGIAGFGEACRLAQQRLSAFSKIADLRNYLEQNLYQIAGENIRFFSNNTPRLANTCFYSLRNISNQTQLINFDLNNICVSAGASCSSGTVSQSRILKAMRIEHEFLDGAIRVSLSPQTTLDDINYFIKIFSEFYQRTITKNIKL